MTRGRWLRVVLFGSLAVLILGRWFAVTATDRMWAESLGVGGDHAAIMRLKTALFLGAFALASAWTLANLAVVYRSIGSVYVPRRLANIEIVEALPRRFLLMTVVAIGLALSLAMSFRAGDWWPARALTARADTLGLIEPILGRDLGYYLFQLPWQRTMHGFALMLSVVMFGVLTIGYVAIGAFAAEDRGLRVTDHARRHLGGVLVLVALVLVWGYGLEAPEGVAGLHGIPFDTVLVDVRLPTARILSALALLAAVGTLVWIRYDRFSIVAFGWITLATFSVVGHYLIPAVAGGSRAEADRLPAEFLEARERWETVAYGSVTGGDSLLRAARRHQTLAPDAVPVWREFAVRVIANRVFAPDSAADEVDLGLSLRDGVPEWLVVSRSSEVVAEPAILSFRADTATLAGAPVFSRGGAGEPSPRVWFGPQRTGVVVDSTGRLMGASPAGVLDRLALAWRLQRWSLLSAASQAQVVFTRDVVARLERYAPFADFADPRPVWLEGRLTWLADGYVSAEAFPLSRTVDWRGRNVGYLRSGLVGMVDAATGGVRVLLRPEPDPLAAAWQAWAPEVIEPYPADRAVLDALLGFPVAQFDAWIGLLGEHTRATRLPFFPRARGESDASIPQATLTADRAPGAPRLALRRRTVLETPEGPVLLEGSVERGVPAVRRYPLSGVGAGATEAARRLAETASVGVGSALTWVWTSGGWAAVQALYSTNPADSLPYVTEVAADLGVGVGRGPTLEAALTRATELSRPGAGGRDGQGDWASARLWFERLDRSRRVGDWVSFGVAYETLRRLFEVPPDSLR